MHRHHGFASHKSEAASPLQKSLDAGSPDHWNPLQWIHDVQARVGELGAADHLAGDRSGDLLRVRTETQQRAAKFGTVGFISMSLQVGRAGSGRTDSRDRMELRDDVFAGSE